MWYTFLGALVTITVSLIYTAIRGGNNPKDIPAELLAPFVRKIVHGSDETDKVYIQNSVKFTFNN
jgi:hypothetical protein